MESLAAAPSPHNSAAAPHHQPGSETPPFLCAVVTETDDGFPCSVACAERSLAVAGVIQAFPGVAARYQRGDTVLVAETDRGVMVYGAAQMRGAPAQARLDTADERIVIDAKGITLKGEKATVELLDDGRIRISSQHLLTISRGPTTIKGSTIELN